MGDYAKDVLVSTDWVAEHLKDDANVVVVEVDEDTEAYGRGHIPGAIAWNWRSDLQDPVRRDFISRDGSGEALSVATASATTRRSSCTAGTTTGSPRTRTGTCSTTATRTRS